MVDGLLKGMHVQKIGVIYPNDSFGSTVLAGVQAAMKDRGAEPVASAAYQRQSNQIDAAIDEVKAANPDAVVVVGPSNTVSPIIKRAHAKGWKPLFLTVSFVGTDELISDAGAEAEGMIVTQVVPPYYLTDLKAVSSYRRALAKYKPTERPNFVSLEGFVDAMVLVEGLKRAGKEPTREGLIHGIESMHELDMGLGPELKLDYSAKDHKGLDHVMPTVVRGGRAVPFTDWMSVAPK
jgi:branched-chain amino acid transport system substrate-binding protein